jgi:hypothetical protein
MGQIDHRQPTVIITMILVGMVQMPVNQIVDMSSVGHSFMAASWAMDVRLVVTTTIVIWRARFRIDLIDVNLVFINMVFM